MYLSHFNLNSEPFSIAPDPKFLYMSAQHKEALAHLMYGIQSSGAFILLTGEVGAGKTTVCRCFLEQVPSNVDVAFLLNPKLNACELLASICDELSIEYDDELSVKCLVDAINVFLLDNHGKQRNTVVIIEEAQNLSPDVLEQLRLLTNLETNERKLLQIILLAQPELLDTLTLPSMKQLSQRITARFHLKTLEKNDCYGYLNHRVAVAGSKVPIFSKNISDIIFKESKGIPRLINVISDRALLGAYAAGTYQLDKKIINKAAKEVKGDHIAFYTKVKRTKLYFSGVAAIAIVAIFLLMPVTINWKPPSIAEVPDRINLGRLSKSQALSVKAENRTVFISSADAEGAQRNDLDFNKVLKKKINDRVSYKAAKLALLDLWNIEEQPSLSSKSLCDTARAYALDCIVSKGNIGTLVKLNRPVILSLIGKNGSPFYGLLKQNPQAAYELIMEGQTFVLSADELDSHWLGSYELLWRPPSGFRGSKISVGERGQAGLWLNEALSQLVQSKLLVVEDDQFASLPALSTEFRPAHLPYVKQLQRQAGIRADGVVGARTIIFINSLLDGSVPRLNSELALKGLR